MTKFRNAAGSLHAGFDDEGEDDVEGFMRLGVLPSFLYTLPRASAGTGQGPGTSSSGQSGPGHAGGGSANKSASFDPATIKF